MSKICTNCEEILNSKYIKCIKCNLFICLNCFSKGFERPPHLNDHPYEVYKYDFTLFESSWSVQKELDLLNAISVSGYGNWTEIVEHMKHSNDYPKLTPENCELHYNKNYLIYTHPLLPEMPISDAYFTQPPGLTFRASVNLPRPVANSLLHQEMGGYSAARSDFMTEYNDHAEFNIVNLKVFDDSDYEDYEMHLSQSDKLNLKDFENDLKLEIIKIYRGVLKERWKRKKKIADFGLISMNKEIVHSKRFESLLGHHFVKSMKAMTAFMNPLQWDLCMESFYLVQKVKRQIKDLQYYRMNGLRHKQSIAIFRKLQEKRKEIKSKVNLMATALQYFSEEKKYKPWTEKKNIIEGLTGHIKLAKKPSTPLDITNIHGVDLLTEAEKELCSTSRLIPSNYLEIKQTLMAENAKHGGLKLAQARTLIKIDVNKTRRIYDFLIKEKLIHCNEDYSRKKRKYNNADIKDELL